MLANVVTSADFDTKPWQLQGLDDVGASFDDFVTYNQNEILLKLLGQTLLDAFSAGVSALPAAWGAATNYVVGNTVLYGTHVYQCLVNNSNVVPTADPVSWGDQGVNRWAQLLYGDDYTILNRKYHYNGIKAFMIPYIYAMWLLKESTYVTGTGDVVSANYENSTTVSPAIRVMQAYIEFKKLVMNGYKDIAIFIYWLCRRSNQGTLYGFIYANDAIYFADVSTEGDDTTVAYLMSHFEPLGSINDFDL